MLRDHRSRRAVVVALVIAPVLLLGVFAAATYTPLFHVRHVSVRGAPGLSRSEIERLAGIDPSTNVFHVDTGALEVKLQQDPRIQTASVDRELPGTLVIRIRERTPVAAIEVGGASVAVAGDGTLLPGSSTGGLPMIQVPGGVPSDSIRITAAQAVAAMSAALRDRVRALVPATDGEITIDIAGGLSVDYGQGGDDAQKVAALDAILRWAAAQHLTLRTVDVSIPSAPSGTLVDGTSVQP